MNAVKTITNEQIKEALVSILETIAPEVDYTTLDPNVDVQKALDIDSFDFLNFLIGIEELLGVNVPEADYGQLVSLSDIITYIVRRV